MYILTPQNETDFWVQTGKGQHFQVFVGIKILFSMQSCHFWATVYRQLGLDCYSGQWQFSQRAGRAGLNYISECYVGRTRQFDLKGQTEPMTLCICIHLCVFVCTLVVLNWLELYCKSCFCRTVLWPQLCISKSIKWSNMNGVCVCECTFLKCVYVPMYVYSGQWGKMRRKYQGDQCLSPASISWGMT